MRAPPHHDYRDTIMRQKVVHKQFNSPINLYSEQNIANSIRQQTSPLPPAGAPPAAPQAAPPQPAAPVQHKLFEPLSKGPAPTPKPMKQPDANLKGKQTTFVSSLQEEHIQQSNSFKRLMYHVLGDAQA